MHRATSDHPAGRRWQPSARDLGELRARIAAYGAAGVQHIMVASDLLRSAEIDNWDDIIEGVGQLIAEQSG